MIESTQSFKPVQLNRTYPNLVVGSSAVIDANTNIIIDDVCLSQAERQCLEGLHHP